MEDDALGHMEDLFDSAHLRPQLRNACSVKLGFDNGPGYATSELKVQHLLWRLARKLGWHHLICQAQAPDQSSMHWQSEQPWSIIRRGLSCKALGWSWCDGDPADQPLPMAEIERKTAASAMKEYRQLLLNIAADGDHDWRVTSRHPRDFVDGEGMEHSPPDGALPWIQDAPLLDEYYSATREEQVRADKYARLRAESLDVGRHIVAKSPSHLEFRNCMSGNPCALCAQALDRRRRDLPNFTMEALLAPLAFNDYRLPYPTYIEGRAPVSGPPPENASARAPTPAGDRELAE